ncbi:MAG: aromatic ring-hydroxylating dioxygenase subunit alpha [Pseudomonadota bacterium]
MADDQRNQEAFSDARCPGTSYTDLLDQDSRQVPEFLREESYEFLGTDPISTDRYTSPEFMRLENEKMWRNVWQFAAREEEMPDPGDTVLYENAGRSYILVRQKDRGVRAFHNFCLHRGRKLRSSSGYSPELKCPFHGFTWNNDGTLKEVPCKWDFGHLKEKEMSLPELRVDRWQGFIMVSEKQDIEPFEEWAGPAVRHYDRWRLDECYTAAWVARVIPANWKATAEAFMEAWHSIVTHPQILPFTGDANTRYDIYGDHMNRAITPSAVLSPHLGDKGHDQAFVLQKMADFAATKKQSADGEVEDTSSAAARRVAEVEVDTSHIPLDDPNRARKVAAETNRVVLGEKAKQDFSDISDSELTDNFTYNIFPNFSPWGGFIPNIIYRWRPWGDPDHCLMEVRILARNPQDEPMPRSATMHLIPDDQPFASASDVIGAALAGVYDQDMANLPYVQEGMKASPTRQLQLGNYQEVRIRHFHRTLDKYLSQ